MLNKHLKKLAVICFGLFGCLLIISAQASIFGWHLSTDIKSNTNPNSEYYKRLPLLYVDDITKDQDAAQVKLTKEEEHQALVWGLTDQEEQRFVLLMQNRSGLYYKDRGLSPVIILGFNARTNKERNYYAELAAKQRAERIARELAFNAMESNAAANLNKKLGLKMLLPFNYAQYSPYSYQPIILKNDDKLMLFVKPHDSVRPIVSTLMAAVDKNHSTALNIYFVGDTSANEIVTWAKGQSIPPEMVNSHLITLNNDKGQYNSISVNDKRTPLLILIRAGKSQIIDTGRF